MSPRLPRLGLFIHAVFVVAAAAAAAAAFTTTAKVTPSIHDTKRSIVTGAAARIRGRRTHQPWSSSPPMSVLYSSSLFREDETPTTAATTPASNMNQQQQQQQKQARRRRRRRHVVEQFVEAYTTQVVDDDFFQTLLAPDCILDDYRFWSPCVGRSAVERRMRLQQQQQQQQQSATTASRVVVDAWLDQENKVGVLFHYQQHSDDNKPNHHPRGCAWLELVEIASSETSDSSSSSSSDIQIQSIRWTVEAEESDKAGEDDLKLLASVSKILTQLATVTTDDDDDDKTEASSETAATATTPSPAAAAISSGSSSSIEETTSMTTTTTMMMTPPEQYFGGWNRRDMDAAMTVFSDDITYDDTAFPKPFQGRKALQQHLELCAAAFPDTFTFQVDDQIIVLAAADDAVVAEDTADNEQQPQEQTRIMVQWHVENNGQALPFTSGLSIYTLDNKNNNTKIQDAIDFLEPSPWPKTRHVLGNFIGPLVFGKLRREPIRLVPAAVWLAYLYIVFLSDGILPGANALQLEARTWEEVRDLSLNFWLVAPVLELPFSPVVHPVLEGVFNWLLAWAALFAGFLSDDRPNKPNVFPMVPAVVGMQFLTSAFFLPYLVLRTSEAKIIVDTNPTSRQEAPVADEDHDKDEFAAGRGSNHRCGSGSTSTSIATSLVYQEDLSVMARIVESRAFAPVLALVGMSSIVWALVGRWDDFGAWSDGRWTSFVDLLSIDRVGSSFLVDLAIFALFQPWLIDDDMKRRGMMTKETQDDETITGILSRVGKYVPFFGLAAYMTLRPTFPSSKQQEKQDE